ncbi:MAG: hypothetical protein IJ899_15795 [Blautia sp.]|nr:hypothetical protein [Blautia sp.]
MTEEPGDDDWPQVTTTTWYKENGEGTWIKHVVSEVVTAFGPPDDNMGLDGSAFKIRKE